MSTRTIWLNGSDTRIRAAVLGVITETPLRYEVKVPARADYRGSITLQAPQHRMGTGLELLWDVANSLTGHGSVLLTELVANVDAESVRVVSHALNVLAGVTEETAA